MEIRIEFTDPAIQAALQRQAERFEISVATYCEEAVLDVLKSDEEDSTRGIYPEGGPVTE